MPKLNLVTEASKKHVRGRMVEFYMRQSWLPVNVGEWLGHRVKAWMKAHCIPGSRCCEEHFVLHGFGRG